MKRQILTLLSALALAAAANVATAGDAAAGKAKAASLCWLSRSRWYQRCADLPEPGRPERSLPGCPDEGIQGRHPCECNHGAYGQATQRC